MQYRTVVAAATSVLLSIPGLTGPPALQAQEALPPRTPASIAIQLQSLARERALLWASTAPVIRCAPAPLTERPTASAEFARPPVLPLETAFLDAAAVKRTFAVRESRSGGGSSPRSD